jgi:transposase
MNVPWARPDRGFTLLFEQDALLLMCEMPAAAAARIIGVADQRLWRILQFYVRRAIEQLDLHHVEAMALDETAARRGQEYVGCSSISTPPSDRCCSSFLAKAGNA